MWHRTVAAIIFTHEYVIGVFLEYSDLAIANECSCSVALETNGAVMVLRNVFSLSYKFIFLNKEQDQRNVALKRKTLER